ncbi:MAG: carboxypeptidase-like regulatory domain-containing protein [Cyanobacteria bacterium P01_C01_bin.120]
MKSLALGLLLSGSILLGGASAAWGHAVQTDYFVDLFAEDLQLEFTASFSTGEPMADATVIVYAPGDRETPWATATTDDTGHYTFKPDPELAGDWRIEFAQDGHKDIRIVPINDMGIDYQNISDAGDTEFHQLAHLRMGLAVLSAAAVGTGAIVFQRRWFKRF